VPTQIVDVRIEEHTDHARKKITTVPVYRLKIVDKKKITRPERVSTK
jgi:hypothetical protein